MPTWIDAKLVVSTISVLIAISVFGYSRFKAKKELTYDDSLSHLNAFDAEFAGRLQLHFDGNPVSNISFVKVTLRNSGAKSVEKKDFDGPLIINVSADELLWSALTEVNRDSIESRVKIESHGNRVELAPLLINAGDIMSISILAKGYKGLSLVASISEVAEIKRIPMVRAEDFTPTLKVFFVLAIIAACLMFVPTFSDWQDPLGFLFAGAAIALIGSLAFKNT